MESYPMWLYPCIQGNLDVVTDTHIRIMPCDDEGWGQGNAPTSWRRPMIAKQHKKLGENHGTDSSHSPQ